MRAGGWRALKASRQRGFDPRTARSVSQEVALTATVRRGTERALPFAGRGSCSRRAHPVRGALLRGDTLSSRPFWVLTELSAACRAAEPRGKGGVAAYVCAKVSPPPEEVRLLGRSRRAGANRRSVANSRGDAVAHVPPERSEWRGSCAGEGGG